MLTYLTIMVPTAMLCAANSIHHSPLSHRELPVTVSPTALAKSGCAPGKRPAVIPNAIQGANPMHWVSSALLKSRSCWPAMTSRAIDSVDVHWVSSALPRWRSCAPSSSVQAVFKSSVAHAGSSLPWLTVTALFCALCRMYTTCAERVFFC